MRLLSHPKYGESDARSASSQRSDILRKLASLNDDQTENARDSAESRTGSTMWPRMKKALPSTTHWSGESSTRVENSGSGTRARHGASAPKQSGRSSSSVPHVAHFQVIAATKFALASNA